MFHHIVLMRLSGADAAFRDRVSDYASRIRSELPYVRSYAFGPNLADRAGGYDWAILSSFATAADQDLYQVCDLHQEMKAFMAPFIEALIACDFETD